MVLVPLFKLLPLIPGEELRTKGNLRYSSLHFRFKKSCSTVAIVELLSCVLECNKEGITE